MSYDSRAWQKGTATTNASGGAAVVFPVPYAAGVVPVVIPSVVAPAGSTSNYNVQLDGPATNVGFKAKVNVTQPTVSILVLGTVALFTAAPAGIAVAWESEPA